MAFGKKKTLRVEFYEVKDQKLIGFDEMLLKEIPEDFREETWVDIDGDRWKVKSIDPPKIKTAYKDGSLKVKVELVSRGERFEEEIVAPVEEVKEAVVYRNPSRADQLPRMSGKREGLDLMEIASYEWRDLELTAANNRSTVREVFGKIQELIQLNSTQREGRTFYTRQYERYDMFAPMRGARLALETVITDYFPLARSVDGLTFMGSEKVADSTFVFQVPSGIGFYGQEFDDIIRYFAVTRPNHLSPALLLEDATKLAAIMKRKELILVDWQARQIIEASPEAVNEFFLKGFAADAVAEALASQAAEAPATLPEIAVSAELEISSDTPASTAHDSPEVFELIEEVPATIEELQVPLAEVQAPVALPEGLEAIAESGDEIVAQPEQADNPTSEPE